VPLDIDTIDFNQPANVHWFAEHPPLGQASYPGESQRFGSVATAIWFVMQTLATKPHAAPWITTDAGHSFELDAIKRLHTRLKTIMRDPAAPPKC